MGEEEYLGFSENERCNGRENLNVVIWCVLSGADDTCSQKACEKTRSR